jgi:hypothetical protein
VAPPGQFRLGLPAPRQPLSSRQLEVLAHDAEAWLVVEHDTHDVPPVRPEADRSLDPNPTPGLDPVDRPGHALLRSALHRRGDPHAHRPTSFPGRRTPTCSTSAQREAVGSGDEMRPAPQTRSKRERPATSAPASSRRSSSRGSARRSSGSRRRRPSSLIAVRRYREVRGAEQRYRLHRNETPCRCLAAAPRDRCWTRAHAAAHSW